MTVCGSSCLRFFLIPLALLALPLVTSAQRACATNGLTINALAEFGQATYANGDVTVANTNLNPTDTTDANWLLQSDARVSNFGALTIAPGAIVRLKAGAVLTLHGDLENNGFLFLEPGATIHFYGKTWKNHPQATLGDGSNTPNTTPGGAVNFIAPRPEIPPNINAAQCILDNYGTANVTQLLDGGNVPMDIALHVFNPNNLQLINTPARLEGLLFFDVPDGDLLLDSNNFIFTKNAGYEWNIPNARDACLVTNGPDNCSGFVEKEGLLPHKNFVFPTARFEKIAGQHDFCPAVIQNEASLPDDFKVSVKTYAEARAGGALLQASPLPGMDHQWQIISGNASPALVNFTHDYEGPGTDYNTMFSSAPRLPAIQHQAGQTWMLSGEPHDIGDGTGSPGAARLVDSSYSAPITGDTCNDPIIWHSKTPEYDTSIQIALTAQKDGCRTNLKATLSARVAQVTATVERSVGNQQYFVPIGTPNAASDYTLSFTDEQPVMGKNTYRIKVLLANNKTVKYARDTTLYFDCNAPEPGITIHPNPVVDALHLSGIHPGDQVQLYGVNGQLVVLKTALSANETLDMTPYAAGVYTIIIRNERERLLVRKIVKLLR